MDSHSHPLHVLRARPIVAALAALTFSVMHLHADGAGDVSIPHVRAVDARFNTLVAEGARRSPSFQALLDRLNRSTVFIYVHYGLLSNDLTGRLTFVGASSLWRYLRIEIECRQSTDSQIAALGHELQHAVEIADRATVLDQRSIRALYGVIGFPVDGSRRRFESLAAKQAGERVRHELSQTRGTSRIR